MNARDPYQGLRFERETQPAIPRWGVVLGSLAIFTVVWLVIPHGVLYWLSLPVLALMVWLASFSWRRALGAVHDFIHQLEEL